MRKETPKVKNPLGMLVMTAIVISCVGYLYWQVLGQYLAGGADAPNLATVIVSGVLLAGGCVYVLSCAIRIFLQARKEKKEEEKQKPGA